MVTPHVATAAAAGVDDAARIVDRAVAHGPANLVDQVAAIVAKADDEIGQVDIERLVSFTSRWDPSLPALPAEQSFGGLEWLARHGKLPATDRAARVEVDGLRHWIARIRIDADPAVTEDTLITQVAEIVTRHERDITQADMDRLAIIAGLRGPKAPTLPGDATGFGLDRIVRQRWLPADEPDAALEVRRLRRWVIQQTDAGIEAVRRQLEAGVRPPANVLEALAHGPGLLERAGLEHATVLRGTIDAIEQAAAAGSNDVRDELRLASALINEMPIEGPSQQAIVAHIDELLDDNLSRLDGNLEDGYEGWVDFADLGRIVSAGRALDTIHTPTGTAVADAARGASLGW